MCGIVCRWKKEQFISLSQMYGGGKLKTVYGMCNHARNTKPADVVHNWG